MRTAGLGDQRSGASPSARTSVLLRFWSSAQSRHISRAAKFAFVPSAELNCMMRELRFATLDP
jgi:hypothetical protein